MTMSKEFISIGDTQKRIETNPFKESQLKRLNAEELRDLVYTYRPTGLRPLYIKHLLKTFGKASEK